MTEKVRNFLYLSEKLISYTFAKKLTRFILDVFWIRLRNISAKIKKIFNKLTGIVVFIYKTLFIYFCFAPGRF